MPEAGGSSATADGTASAVNADEARLHDVFVSYASADSPMANELVAALERAGLSCWIAPRDVTPGAVYADVIIRAINGAKALVLVLSRHSVSSSHVGKEVERASAKHRPIIALRTDVTPLTPALEYFLSESQWIDVSAEELAAAAAKIQAAVRRLSAARSDPRFVAPDQARPAASSSSGARPGRGPGALLWAVLVVVIAGVIYLLADKLWFSRRQPVEVSATTPVAMSAPAKAAGPPPHSIAVLPFVNLSGDPQQDYFSDGLSEELLNSLAAIPDLQVAARTSSFSFKGKNADVQDIARKLNVGAVLEGSVRKDGNEVRITAQLINALTGFHFWSHTYDRDLKNVLALQTEIATAVTQSLQATLLANAPASVELGGTQNAEAFDAYLRGKNLDRLWFDEKHGLEQIAAYQEAIRHDPKFAKAYAELAASQDLYANMFAVGGPGERSRFQESRANAEKAVELAPGLGRAHAVLADVLSRGFLDFAGGQQEYDRALSAAPNDANVLAQAGLFKIAMGKADSGIEDVKKSVALDPLNPTSYSRLSYGLFIAGRYQEVMTAANRALELNALDIATMNQRGIAEFLVGEVDAARKDCNMAERTWLGRLCMSLLYEKVHQHGQAEAELAMMQKAFGDGASYQYTEIYAQWGDLPKALHWLDVAYALPDPGMAQLKVDPLLEPLRKEPHFQEIVRKLKFPD